MIEVTELRKRYGATQSLDGMTFSVRPGQVTGFVGPNGAGKSTTMRIILGLDAADAGTALINGQPYRTLRHPLSHVGALLDAAALQPSRSARNHLLWLAYSQGLTAKRVDEVIDQAGLRSVIRRKAGGYSLGMRQRLGIAAALLGDPPVLMLDEPFNGMDPEGIIWLRGFLRALAAQGRAVLVSSHLMGELQDTADHLVVAGRGRVIADASVKNLIAAASGDRVRLRTSARAEAIAALGSAGATVAATASDLLVISDLPRNGRWRSSTAADVPFSEVSAHRATLEDAYLQLTKDAVEFRADRPVRLPARRRRRDDGHPVPLQARPGGDAFAQLLRAEWVKFRTVRGWVAGLIVAALAIMVLGLGPSATGSCGAHGPASDCAQTLGPGGEPVTDSFYFVRQPLDGNGSITVRVTSLTGQIPDFSGSDGTGGGARRCAAAWCRGPRPGSSSRRASGRARPTRR